MKGLLLGMGNPILSDDGVGLLVVRQLAPRLPHMAVAESALVGMGLLDLMEGYDRLFLVDALIADNGEVGDVRRLSPEQRTCHLVTSHGASFPELLQMGRDLGRRLPREVAIYGIVIASAPPFGERLSPYLSARMQAIVDCIAADIRCVLAAEPPTP
jgi:hydrogenase maturation protease